MSPTLKRRRSKSGLNRRSSVSKFSCISLQNAMVVEEKEKYKKEERKEERKERNETN